MVLLGAACFRIATGRRTGIRQGTHLVASFNRQETLKGVTGVTLWWRVTCLIAGAVDRHDRWTYPDEARLRWLLIAAPG